MTLTTADEAAWHRVLAECAPYDCYHLPRYHRLAELQGEGTARLFVYRRDGHTIALPLLIRSLDGHPGAHPGWCDAATVYGYAGPIASPGPLPRGAVAGFQSTLARALNELQVVSVVARLNPFLPQRPMLLGLGRCVSLRRTVSIDLTLPPDVQRAKYRKNHKSGVNRLRRMQVACVRDEDRHYLTDFISIYHETMERVEARPSYYFSPEYFHSLLDSLGPKVQLFVCLHEERPISAGLFFECCGIVQYHLGGTVNDALTMAPMKQLLDAVRLWGTERGCKVFHLGGGASARDDDPLLHFKRGFSDREHDFEVWQWILMPEAFRAICQGQEHHNRRRGLRCADANFFPAYRSPTVPVEPPIETPQECS